MSGTRAETLAAGWAACRAELTGYVTRLVVRPDVAEEIVQEAAARILAAPGAPEDARELRAWLFRVASNLAIDHLRRHSTWRETVLLETRGRAEADEAFVAESARLKSTPETRAIAREHLAVCFACALRNLTPSEAAALLLREVYGFSNDEVAEMLEARFAQAKAWIQSARAKLTARYAETCVLVSKRGVCHQCVELDGYFEAHRGDPLAGTARVLDARLEILRDLKSRALGPWHRRMLRLVDEVLRG